MLLTVRKPCCGHQRLAAVTNDVSQGVARVDHSVLLELADARARSVSCVGDDHDGVEVAEMSFRIDALEQNTVFVQFRDVRIL